MPETRPNRDPGKIAAQFAFYVSIALLIGYFSAVPEYQYSDGRSSILKLVVRHSGVLVGECRRMNEDELKKLPPNMRITEVCPREKSPMNVSLEIDKNLLYQGVLKPSGLHNDGVIALYKEFRLSPGLATVQMTIESGNAGRSLFEQEITVNAAEVILLEFHDDGFTLLHAGGSGA